MMRRYVFSAVCIALCLLFLTIAAVVSLVTGSMKDKGSIFRADLIRIAEGLQENDGSFVMGADAQTLYRQWFVWAMLIDQGGNVIWSDNLPEDFPTVYSAADVASFSGWYLQDYPVTVWQWQEGNLLVLGSEPDSLVRYKLVISSDVFNRMLHTIPILLVGYILASFMLAIFFAYRMFRRVKPVTSAIADLSKQKSICVPTGGLLDDIAKMLNQVSEELENQRSRLQSRDESRAEWIAGISHDIRTPLSMVMGYASQLEQDDTLSANHRKKASIICSQSHTIKNLVADLNLSSKLEYGWENAMLVKIPVAPLLRAVLAQYLNSGLASKYSLSLEIAPSATELHVQGNEGLLMRMLQNLINNSLLHNPEGCSIVVSLDCESACIRLCIADDGNGIIPFDLTRKHNESFAKREHGIGLSLVSKIAKIHHGSFFIQPNEPKGLRTIVLLPSSEA